MSYKTPRISADMSYLDIIMTLSEGNPGAVKVLIVLFENAARIDPDSSLGPWGVFFSLDTLDCYGPNIWVFYKDLCGADPVKMIALLRAVQLGYTSDEKLMAAIQAQRPLVPHELDIDSLVAKVRARLKNFDRPPETPADVVREALQDAEANRETA